MSMNSIRRVTTVVAIAGAAALVTPALGHAADTGSLGSLGSLGSAEAPAAGFTCDALSTETTPAGWGVPFDDEQNQKATYSAENVLDENGSLALSVEKKTDRQAWYHSAGSIKLADVIGKDMGFAEKADSSKAAFQIRLLGTTGGKFENGFTTLVWTAGEDAPDTKAGATHEKIQTGTWWSTQNIDGAKDRKPVTLEEISKANPDAIVEHYGVSIGSGSENASTLVDAVKFNGCTTDFAKKDAEPAPAGSLGSLGALFGSLGS
ncbi:hypothetical protein [Prescottella subtropica]|uniref:hypothetical protein n=1 Tax=Prescottella subtropica TaxID=2545757 RepID=UPI0010F4FE5C|nr:hypothetical protein [Prescottella subtropica]